MVSQAENWKLVQTIGAKPLGSLVDGDVISAVEFDGEKSFHLHTILYYSGVYTGSFLESLSCVTNDQASCTGSLRPQSLVASGRIH
jgi:hypothetical protein